MLVVTWLIVAALVISTPNPTLAQDRDATDAFVAMATAGAAYVNDNTSCPGVISAVFLLDDLSEFTVIDIRSEVDFLAGHIPGAYHSTLSTLIHDLETFIPTDKPYVIACYSGQSSGHAKIALELLGYQDVYSLLFGMSAWNATLDVWSAHCADELANPETENQNGNLVQHPYPELVGDPETIVSQRVAAMLAGGYRGISYQNIADNLEEYFIINYFGEADYQGEGTAGVPGHIPGAFQFTPYASLSMDQMLSNIPVDQPVVVYCWTGQHSSQITAYLNMLGYDAYSLKWGANALFYSDLIAHKWSPAQMHDYPLETGPMSPVPAPELPLVTGLGNHPNPFNPATTISYRLSHPAQVTLRIYDLAGRLVSEPVRGTGQEAGLQEIAWRGMSDDGRPVPSGTYIYRLDAGGFQESRRLMLLK